MALIRKDNNGGPAVARYRDPFQMARELLTWDPYGGRQMTAFAPAFEVKETNEQFILRADLPGVSESDLDVSLHDNVLTVSGSRQNEERKEGESFALYERQFGSFSRGFSLPEVADGSRIEAKLSDGVLTLTIAKKEAAKPRKIALKK
jgi:HSP20 family protein